MAGSLGSSRSKSLDKPIEEYITEHENKNTSKNWQGCEATYSISTGGKRTKETGDLNRCLGELIVSVKRKDGQDNGPSSLRGLFSSFNRYLKERKYSASIIEDILFEKARKCLEARSKQLKREGKGNWKLTDVEENIL